MFERYIKNTKSIQEINLKKKLSSNNHLICYKSEHNKHMENKGSSNDIQCKKDVRRFNFFIIKASKSEEEWKKSNFSNKHKIVFVKIQAYFLWYVTWMIQCFKTNKKW